MRLNKIQQAAVTALEDIKATDIVVLDTRSLTSLYDTLIIATAESARQTKALGRNVQDKVRTAGGHVRAIEGEESGEWVLVDCEELVVHIMLPQTRSLYNLEELWTPIAKPKTAKPVKTVASKPSVLPTLPVKKRSKTVEAVVEPTMAAATTRSKAKPIAASPSPAAVKTPAAKKPATKTAATKKPAAKKPAAKTTAKTTAKTSAAKKPAIKKTAAKKPATKKPATKKPAAKKPSTAVKVAAKKPATKKPAAKKPAAKKPATKKPAAKPAARKRG